MSWVSDLSSALGIPAGAATVAVAIYAGCAAAENVARPEALHDIASYIKGSRRTEHFISNVFKLTFGEKQLSGKCVRRSVAATFFFNTAITMAFIIHTGRYPFQTALYFLSTYTTFSYFITIVIFISVAALAYLFVAAIPDFLSLWKTRFLLNILFAHRLTIFLVFIDIMLSLFISLFCLLVWMSVIYSVAVLTGHLGLFPKSFFVFIINIVQQIRPGIEMTFAKDSQPVTYVLASISTLLTSVWIASIYVSSVVLKILSPIDRFTLWFFDVDKNPLRSIGTMAGVLIITGSLVWSFARAEF